MRRKGSTQPRDVRLEAVSGGCGRTVAPDVVDQALVRYDIPRTEQKRGENRTLLAPAQLDRAAADLGFERAEDAESECSGLARGTRS
jgi:hypothetical protein